MKQTKKPLSVCETGSGEDGQLVIGECVLPDSHSTTGTNRLQGISALLLHGEANAIPISLLAAWTGLDRRAIRRQVQAERQAGSCICVNNHDGYFLAETEVERARCVESMRRRAAETYRTADAIERAEVSV